MRATCAVPRLLDGRLSSAVRTRSSARPGVERAQAEHGRAQGGGGWAPFLRLSPRRRPVRRRSFLRPAFRGRSAAAKEPRSGARGRAVPELERRFRRPGAAALRLTARSSCSPLGFGQPNGVASPATPSTRPWPFLTCAEGRQGAAVRFRRASSGGRDWRPRSARQPRLFRRAEASSRVRLPMSGAGRGGGRAAERVIPHVRATPRHPSLAGGRSACAPASLGHADIAHPIYTHATAAAMISSTAATHSPTAGALDAKPPRANPAARSWPPS